jgi:hypothetical protein
MMTSHIGTIHTGTTEVISICTAILDLDFPDQGFQDLAIRDLVFSRLDSRPTAAPFGETPFLLFTMDSHSSCSTASLLCNVTMHPGSTT